ncbi:hypothetical protein [Elongatibacter sediminis]|uniref:hypothetical protein n=1 Tax=Elongatibacter sediminis TaxID=3119006 RepID=UPI00339D676B
MKYWLALFVLFYALQPMQLQACDMDNAQESAHHSTMLDEAKQDCCDPEEESMSHACMDATTCGTCTFGLTLLPAKSGFAGLTHCNQLEALGDSNLAAAHSHPPFRPPIA